jgi:hypothetical protein
VSKLRNQWRSKGDTWCICNDTSGFLSLNKLPHQVTTAQFWKAGSISPSPHYITKTQVLKVSAETAIHLLPCSTINAHQFSIRCLEFPKQSHIFWAMSHFHTKKFWGIVTPKFCSFCSITIYIYIYTVLHTYSKPFCGHIYIECCVLFT